MKPASAVKAMALRGAVAAAAALAITTVLSVQRPYWVIMIAVVLVNQTTGQSLQRSGQRIAATVGGFAAGWALEWITSAHHLLQVAAMLLAVFLAVFFRQAWGRGSFPWMMFFISLYVVFLFALLGEWSPAIFAARVYDTCLGAGAALAATLAIPSPGSKDRLRSEADEWWKHCRSELVAATERFSSGRPTAEQAHADFLRQLDTLQTRAGEAAYETILRHTARRQAAAVFGVTELLCYLALGLFDSMACAPQSAARERLGRAILQLIEPVVNAELTDFVLPVSHETPIASTLTRLNACRTAHEYCKTTHLSGSEVVWALPVIYYAAALHETLRPEARRDRHILIH